MNGLKRVGILLAIAVFVIVLGESFAPGEIQSRAIVLGLGVDVCADDPSKLRLTAEVVSPGNGSEQVGVFSKTVTSDGKSLGEAVAALAEKTGMEPSLGQCGVLLIGSGLYTTRDFSDVMEFFVHSDSFNENAVPCCTDNAEALMNNSAALGQSVSITLVEALREQAKKIALPTNSLLMYARSQVELSRTGYLNFVEFVPSQNSDEQSEGKEQGYFLYNRIAIFRSNRYVCTMTEEETRGFAAMTAKVVGDTFSVTHEGKNYALRTNGKDVKTEYVDGVMQVDVQLQVKLARADSADIGGQFTERSNKVVTEDILAQVEQQASSALAAFLNMQRRENADIAEFHEILRRIFGTTDELCNMPMSDIDVEVRVKVVER